MLVGIKYNVIIVWVGKIKMKYNKKIVKIIIIHFFIFYLFVVDKGVSLAPTYPQLR